MKKRIVFFDIDGVIFSARKFWEDFYIKLSEQLNLDQAKISELRNLYGQVKNEKGFFDPKAFLTKISDKFSIAREDLEKLWWDDVRFQECLLVNIDFFEALQRKAVIGIFSKGELKFQRKKLENFQEPILPENIYIFENKIIKTEEVLNKYKDYEVYVVDDNEEVLENFKKVSNNVITVLIAQDKVVKENFIDFNLANIQDLPQILD